MIERFGCSVVVMILAILTARNFRVGWDSIGNLLIVMSPGFVARISGIQSVLLLYPAFSVGYIILIAGTLEDEVGRHRRRQFLRRG